MNRVLAPWVLPELRNLVAEYMPDPLIGDLRRLTGKQPSAGLFAAVLNGRSELGQLLDRLDDGVPAWKARDDDPRSFDIARTYVSACGRDASIVFWNVFDAPAPEEPTREALGLLEGQRPLGSKDCQWGHAELFEIDEIDETDIDADEPAQSSEPVLVVDGLRVPESVLCDAAETPNDAADRLHVWSALRRKRGIDSKEASAGSLAQLLIKPMARRAVEGLASGANSSHNRDIFEEGLGAVREGDSQALRRTAGELTRLCREIGFDEYGEPNNPMPIVIKARDAVTRLAVCIDMSVRVRAGYEPRGFESAPAPAARQTG